MKKPIFFLTILLSFLLFTSIVNAQLKLTPLDIISNFFNSFLKSLGLTTTATQEKVIPSSGTIVYSRIIVVALDGSGDYRDIQSAINFASTTPESDRIYIKQGVYNTNAIPINLVSDLTIYGYGIDKTIIRNKDGARADVITSESNIENLVIENLTVDNAGTPDNLGSSAIAFRGSNNKNIVIRNVKSINAFGAGISIPGFENVVIENSFIDNVYTGISLYGGKVALVRNNTVLNTKGDAIFPQPNRGSSTSDTDVVIEDNYIENAGDTGIDITSTDDVPPHERITAQRNTLKNSYIRVANAQHIIIKDNVIENGRISLDSGQKKPIDVTVEGNKISTNFEVGIGFYGAQDSKAINNEVTMLQPVVFRKHNYQVGISAGIWGTGLIEGNTIVGSANYGIDFAAWGMGGTNHQTTIRNNKIIDFGKIGIYDNNQNQGPVVVENNIIWDRRNPFVSDYGIRTDYANVWTIRNNRVYAGKYGFISAPNSNVYGNIYEPPPEIKNMIFYNWKYTSQFYAENAQMYMSHRSKFEKLAELNQKGPSVITLLYRNIRAVKINDDDADPPGATEYNLFVNNGWILKNSSGLPVTSTDFGYYMVDVGNPSYQQWVADWMKKYVDQYGYDGVFLDNSLPSREIIWGRTSEPINPRTGKIWTDEEFKQAVIAIVNKTKDAIGSKLVVGNGILNGKRFFDSSRNQNYVDLLTRSKIDGIESEAWIMMVDRDNQNWYSEVEWQQSINFTIWLEDNFLNKGSNKVFLPVTQNIAPYDANSTSLPPGITNESYALYAFASLALAVSGNKSYINYGYVYDNSKVVAYLDKLFNINLGMPLGKYYMIPNTHVYARDFTNVKVLVNPTSTPYPSIDLGGSYKTLDNRIVSTITMNAHTGEILLKI